MRIGAALSGSPETTALLKCAQDIITSTPESRPLPFIIIDDSSGQGKTQLAFSVGRAGYLVLSPSRQPIYANFQHVSVAFRSTMAEDISKATPCPPDKYIDTTLVRSLSMPLQSAGFLKALMQRTQSCPSIGHLAQSLAAHPLPWSPITVADLRVSVKTLQSRMLIIDEALVTPNDIATLCFIRSLCRVVGIVVVLIGTSSTLVPMMNVRGSRAVYPNPWCKVITELSRPSLDSLEAAFPGTAQLLSCLQDIPHLQPLEGLIRSWILKARPLTAIACMEELSVIVNRGDLTEPIAVLDALIAGIDTRLRQAKDGLQSDAGIKGQLAMYMPAYHAGTAVKSKVPLIRNTPGSVSSILDSSQSFHSLILSHFATPCISSTTVHLGTNIFRDDDAKLWRCGAHFRPSDCLSWLALCRRETYLNSHNGPYSIATAYNMAVQVPSDILDERNPAAIQSDDLDLEHIGKIAVLTASHGSLRGSSLDDYIHALCSGLEIGQEPGSDHVARRTVSEVLPKEFRSLGFSEELQAPMPYLLADKLYDSDFPGFSIPSLCTERFNVAAKTVDNIDGFSPSITLESANCSGELDEVKLRVSIMRAFQTMHKNVRLSVLITTRLQDSYFNEKDAAKMSGRNPSLSNWSNFAASWKAPVNMKRKNSAVAESLLDPTELNHTVFLRVGHQEPLQALSFPSRLNFNAGVVKRVFLVCAVAKKLLK
eukprot:m.66027 g.66027  ORF g.66027 m.66027 type:complete len:709 (+) comp7370_c0_seq1:85-2211(+)